MGIIRTIRNCLFDYENEATLEYLIDPKIIVSVYNYANLVNSLLKCMLFNLSKGLTTDPDFDKELDEAIELGKKNGLILGKEEKNIP